MTTDLHFIFKVSADLFGSLVLTISAQLYFQNVQEFGLWARILKHLEIIAGLKVWMYEESCGFS